MDLEKRTIEELRALAKKRGLSGYSKLGKAELVRRLRAEDRAKKATATGKKKPGGATVPKPKAQPKAKVAHERGGVTPPATRRGATARPPSAASSLESAERRSLDSGEVQVEEAKFTLSPRGTSLPPHLVPDLSEDIDPLPAITRAHLRLLPQKPGILYSYWILPSDMLSRRPPLMLRLCHVTEAGVEVIEEFRLQSERGHWYFHLPAGASETEFCVQVGQYRNGDFVSALPRGSARMPTLYASRRTAGAWWVSAEQFRAMYLRAGGREKGGSLAWSASQSSR